MKNNKKKLVIITGITGAIGNAFLCKYSRLENTVVCGISRKASPVENFINPETKKLYDATFIANIGDLDEKNVSKYVSLIDLDKFESITYVHALGFFPNEIDSEGNVLVENDNDGDGINDVVLELSHNTFKRVVDSIANATNGSKIEVSSLIFGAISDKHKPAVHQSWIKSKEMTFDYMKQKSARIGMNMINISSIVSTQEIITRPHVCIQTDADLMYWLTPAELTTRFFEKIETENINIFTGYHEYEIFNKKPNFPAYYYEDSNFSIRKVREVYKVK